MRFRLFLPPVVVALAVASGCLPPSLHACNVPVFRYAMERWPADPYQVIVYQRGNADDPVVRTLRAAADDQRRPANYSVTLVDVTSTEGKVVAERRNIPRYPWVEVFYPAAEESPVTVVSAELTAARIKALIDSPAREHLARKLLSGDAAVWVLVASGDAQKDARARESLRSSLQRASATLRIPETGVDINGNPVEVTDFRTYPVRFGFVEIDRTNLDEDMLVNSLLRSEPDLAAYKEPMAFPVFGRGRALYALVGNGIQEKNIREACESVLSWCSCEIKAQHPGTDLLLAADWSRPFGGRLVKDPDVPLTGLSSFAKKPELVQPAASPVACPRVSSRVALVESAVSSAIPEPVSGPAGSPLTRNLLYVAAAAGISVVALSVFVAARARRQPSGVRQ